jgi:hypothetical protein
MTVTQTHRFEIGAARRPRSRRIRTMIVALGIVLAIGAGWGWLATHSHAGLRVNDRVLQTDPYQDIRERLQRTPATDPYRDIQERREQQRVGRIATR